MTSTLSKILSTFLITFAAISLQAKPLSTSLYENEGEKIQSFTSKVRVVREISEEVEVFFESNEAKGAYILPKSIKSFGTVLKTLQQSQKRDGSAVSVTVDAETKVIKSVEKGSEKSEKYDVDKEFDKILKEYK